MHTAEIDIRNPARVRATLDGELLSDRFPNEDAARRAILREMRERHGLVLAPGETYERED